MNLTDSMRDRIEAKLRNALRPTLLTVEDESANHSRGRESHFNVTIVADVFAGQRLLARHRQVNAAVAQELAGPVHALAMHTYTPEEWQARQAQVPASPECAHGA